jgi:hypothetical protein
MNLIFYMEHGIIMSENLDRGRNRVRYLRSIVSFSANLVYSDERVLERDPLPSS